jgi:hypothetical protein
MQVPPLHASLYAGTLMLVGPVNVEFLPPPGQSTWNFQLTRLEDVPRATT